MKFNRQNAAITVPIVLHLNNPILYQFDQIAISCQLSALILWQSFFHCELSGPVLVANRRSLNESS